MKFIHPQGLYGGQLTHQAAKRGMIGLCKFGLDGLWEDGTHNSCVVYSEMMTTAG